MSDLYSPRLNRPWFAMQFDEATAVADLYLYDVIGYDGIKANDLVEQFLSVNASSLNIYINSPGGDVDEGLTIYNMLKRFKGKKTVYIDGMAASMASVIAMAGDRVVMPETARMFVHKPWTMSVGNADDLQRTAEQLNQCEATIVAAYAKKTGRSAAIISDLLSGSGGDGTLLNASDAMKYGFVDAVSDEQPVSKAASYRNAIDTRIMCLMARQITKENAAMETPEQIAERESKEKADAEAAAAAEKDAADAKAKADAEAAADEAAKAAAATASDPVAQARAEFTKFVARFGAVRAADYFAAGLAFADAERRFTDELIAENAALAASASATPPVVAPAPQKPMKDGAGPADWKAALALHGGDYVKARRAHPDLYSRFMESTK